MEVFQIVDQNRNFPKILTKIEIFGKFLQNARYSENLYEKRGFWNFDKNRDLPMILAKIEI